MVNSRFIQSLDPTVNKDTRSGFGEGLLEVGKQNENAVALCADLTGVPQDERLCKRVSRTIFFRLALLKPT